MHCVAWIRIQAQSNMPKCQLKPSLPVPGHPQSGPLLGVHISQTVGSGSETRCKRHPCFSQKAGLGISCPCLCALQGGADQGYSTTGHSALTLGGRDLQRLQTLPGCPAVAYQKRSPGSLIPFGRANSLSPLWHSEIYSPMLCNFGLRRSLFKARVSG